MKSTLAIQTKIKILLFGMHVESCNFQKRFQNNVKRNIKFHK